MKRMEYDSEFAASQKMVTVPISGLVLSKLYRLENEHMTCLSLWEPKFQANAYNSLENAVLHNDVNEVKRILEDGTTYINNTDCNGTTILHLSCIHGIQEHKKPSIEVTHFLLKNPEIDVMIKNYCGNTAFHYFVQISETVISALGTYRQVLMLFLSKKELLSTKNNNVSFIYIFWQFLFFINSNLS